MTKFWSNLSVAIYKIKIMEPNKKLVRTPIRFGQAMRVVIFTLTMVNIGAIMASDMDRKIRTYAPDILIDLYEGGGT